LHHFEGDFHVTDPTRLSPDEPFSQAGAQHGSASRNADPWFGRDRIGMDSKGSGFVAAINTCPHAAIYNHADVCTVEDLVRFLPELINCVAE
jgi:hypothetical protein